MEDLFSATLKKNLTGKPLAARMRPRSLDEIEGQEHLLGPGRVLRRLIEEDRLQSLILYGPPGSGKTTLAHVIAATTRAEFVSLNAVTSGVAELRRVIEDARRRLGGEGRRTVVFIDEVHRFNKAQQDGLLPAVEQGIIIFVGATTENPFFTINSPLLSRSRLFTLEALTDEQVGRVIDKAVADTDRGLGSKNIKLDPDARQVIIRSADGDARAALNTLELAALAAETRGGGEVVVDRELALESAGRKTLFYDRDGDNHYDIVSAFIKSIRGSDPDAALYWLARMLEGGEDPMFIARRLVISAAEDVGNADPRALSLAVAAAQAVQMIGLPEGRIPLAQAATYLASVPKSNAAYVGIETALEDVRKRRGERVPLHLRDANYPGAKKLGHGNNYRYPHDYPGHYIPQDYLPEGLRGRRYYRPSRQGIEAKIRDRLNRLRGTDKDD